MLNDSYIDCSTCTKNLLLRCERRACEPSCRVSNLYHSLMHIANVSLHYFPIVSHYDNFTMKIKTYLMETLQFQFEQCEHVERLQNIVINNYVSSISQYYFDFLRKLKLGFDLPPDRDCLMETIYASGTRYTKKKSANANYVKEEIVSDDNEAEEIAHREDDVPKMKNTYKRKALDKKV